MRNVLFAAFTTLLVLTVAGGGVFAGTVKIPIGKARYAALIATHARANGVPLALAHAVIAIESRYNAAARGSAGEIGLMQIKLQTARGVGYRGGAKGLYDPETNLRYGMKYLGMAQKLAGGDLCRTVMKYNGGHFMKRPTRGTSAYCGKARKLLAMS
jgi:soluble lytic murein transglycosylase-like protein